MLALQAANLSDSWHPVWFNPNCDPDWPLALCTASLPVQPRRGEIVNIHVPSYQNPTILMPSLPDLWGVMIFHVLLIFNFQRDGAKEVVQWVRLLTCT